ncbi:MAG: serine/threonine protein kinase [Planctomycetota bacterium]
MTVRSQPEPGSSDHGVVRPAVRVLKSDVFGRVELHEGSEPAIVRVAHGSRLPGSGVVARILARREHRALGLLAGLDSVPALMGDFEGGVLRRSFLDGEPLHRTERLPRDFFVHLERLVCELHARGVCHNDLHKEQNVLVRPDGRPALIDFQLASIHPRRGRTFASRCGDDLRHVAKHAARYERRGRPKRPEERSSASLPRRSLVAGLWRRTGKPLYNFVTRRLLSTRDGEERRPSSGPWPDWEPPLGERGKDGQ